MDFDEYKLAFKNYLDEYGMMARVPGETHDGNPLLYLSVAILIADYLYDQKLIDPLYFEELIKTCEPVTGHLNRSPVKKELNAHDDYIGVMAASNVLNTYIFAMRVYMIGSQNGWVFNNTGEEDKIKMNHSRFLDVVPHYKACVRVKLDLWERFRWSLGIIGKALFGNNSSHQLGFCMVQVMKKQLPTYPLLALLIAIFEWRIRRIYGGYSGLFEKYFYKDHIFAVALKDHK